MKIYTSLAVANAHAAEEFREKMRGVSVIILFLLSVLLQRDKIFLFQHFLLVQH